ncbi:phage terminase large subunit [Cellulophaga phage phi12:1]|uniref:Phage terminase large subunit n=2 Tax=Cellulophaga phage phi12:1 TaxID=1327976 RepID=R9ZZN8_9CAUD|nr:terminase large subunit [Cellulophaga phage phi12:1]AGO48000.1 phage terminase large subunit [Cellulophaga phage phi12:1]AGO48165.1 phage terminase large subunit [Cellulophaga phage phi12:3]
MNTKTEQAIDIELCKRSFYYFFKMFVSEVIPEDMVYNWHIELLCDELQQLVERVRDRKPKLHDLLINIPPGTTKSTICTVMLPAWVWIIDPRARIMTSSYTASLSTDHAVKSRDVIKSERYQRMFPGVQIKPDQDNKTHYKNTRGGERYSTSTKGTATGFHAHLHIVDDPINPKGAASDVERAAATSFMDQTLSSRKVSKAVTPCILVMQRLHQEDPTGNWLGKPKKKIRHICLPGEISDQVKPIELKAKYINGLLDPVRMPKEVLDEMRTDLGSYGYAGQVGQIPAPEGGGLWKKWFIGVPDNEFPKLSDMVEVGTDWDLAYTEKEENSASAFVTAGKIENKMYIDALGFKWLEFPELMTWMRAVKAPHYIEAKASGKSAKQTLTRNGVAAIEIQVEGGDKIARAKLASPYAEAGLVYCRQSLLDRLYHDEKQGILLFPNTGTDLNDALCQSISRILSKPEFFVI